MLVFVKLRKVTNLTDVWIIQANIPLQIVIEYAQKYMRTKAVNVTGSPTLNKGTISRQKNPLAKQPMLRPFPWKM